MKTSNGKLVIRAPRILFVAAVIVLGIGIARQFAQESETFHLAGGVLLSCYLAWLFLEMPITFRRAPAKPADMGTLLAYALARLGLLIVATQIPAQWRSWAAWMIVPLAAFVTGVALRLIAMRTLGRWYSHHVASGTGQRTVTSGPYRVIRHPAYAGMLIANISLTAFFFNPMSVVFLLLLATAVTWRILVEERVLHNMPGYSAYSARKHRLIPGVW